METSEKPRHTTLEERQLVVSLGEIPGLLKITSWEESHGQLPSRMGFRAVLECSGLVQSNLYSLFFAKEF